MERLEGKVAIVTGASSGLGWQIATRLAERGVKLCVTARRADALEQLVAEIQRKGGQCLAIAGDVTKDEDVRWVVDGCLAHFGQLDILVNDAAVQAYGHFDELPWEQITRIFDVSCFGYFRFARAVLPHFRKLNRGQIINVLSMLSLGGAPLLSAYSAAKHALWGWAQSLSLELYRTGIEISNVMVPSVATPMFDHAPTNLGLAPQPVPPTYDPDLIARTVVKLAQKPKQKAIPVFLQGKLIVFLNRHLPAIGNFLLGNWGERMQTRDQRIDRPRGNLFEPVPQGVGPLGSVPPTSRWLLWGGATAAVLLGAAGLGGVAYGGYRAAKAL
jgi:short-subunit dehydrogenase